MITFRNFAGAAALMLSGVQGDLVRAGDATEGDKPASSAAQSSGRPGQPAPEPGSAAKPRGTYPDIAKALEEERSIARDALQMVLDSKFEELDKLARDYRESKSRVSGGVWKLRHFSVGMGYPRKSNSKESWDTLLARLKEWHEKTGSVYALNALGHAQLNYAWSVRGHNFAGEVKPEAWGTFDEWVEKARVSLEAARKKDPAYIDIYKSLLHVAISQGWEREKVDSLYKEAIRTEPEYYDVYYNMAFYLMERWYGKPGDVFRFINTIPGTIPGNKGLEIYTRTGMQIFTYYSQTFFGSEETSIQWEKMKGGFEAMNKEYPNLFNRNRFAMFATIAGDKGVAKPLLEDLIGKNEIFPAAWRSEEVLQWAKEQLGIPE